MKYINEVLTKCPLFKGLSYEQIEELLRKVNYNTRKYNKKHTIALTGDHYNSLVIVVNGSVKGEMTDFSGKTIKIEDIETPRPVAFAFLFGMNNKIPVDIVANTDCELLYISKSDVVSMLQINERFLLNYLDALSNRANFLSNKIKFLNFKTIKGKIANYLLGLSKNGKLVSFELPKTQQELADYFGITRPSFARSIGEMVDEGIIKSERKVVTILDKNKLAKLLK